MAIKAYVVLKISTGAEREVCKKIVDYVEVMEASIIYGEYDILAKVVVEDLESLEIFLSESIRNIPSIILTSTMIIAREYKGKIKRNSLKVNKI